MKICDICYAELKEGEGDVCEKCKERKPVKVLMEEYYLTQDEIVKRYIELVDKRSENLKKLKKKTKEIKI